MMKTRPKKVQEDHNLSWMLEESVEHIRKVFESTRQEIIDDYLLPRERWISRLKITAESLEVVDTPNITPEGIVTRIAAMLACESQISLNARPALAQRQAVSQLR